MSNLLSQHRISRRTMLGGMLGLAAVFAGLEACGDTRSIINDCTSITLTPSSNTVQVHFLYSTEKDPWLQTAITAFQNENHQCNGKPIEIIPSSSGSADMVDQILNHRSDPDLVACSPASDLELSRLDYLSAKPEHFGQSIISYNGDLSPKYLVRSPLVFAVWQPLADTLINKYGHIDWDTLYQALQFPKGWEDLGLSGWGKQIHLGQTLPPTSNSGLLALTLMANAYLTSRQLSLNATSVAEKDSGLWDYIDVFERHVNIYGKSSGTYWDIVIAEGSGQYAIVFTYENLVLYENKPQLEMFYPAQNLMSNHPFAILNNPLLSRHPDQLQEQQQAARAFRDFLRRDDQQRAAMHFGFRPWNAALPLVDSGPNDPKNLFDQLKPTNRSSQLSPAHALDTGIDVINAPDGDTVDTLITQWKKKYPNPLSI